jgi:pimeloyl-ACP methyl ester carboxylesterase
LAADEQGWDRDEFRRPAKFPQGTYDGGAVGRAAPAGSPRSRRSAGTAEPIACEAIAIGRVAVAGKVPGMFDTETPFTDSANSATAPPNIVLVHGAWADGSCWAPVIERLQADGYTVTAPQFPLTALADDVARLRLVLGRQDGPTIVAGHSYGGQIVTALGADAPNVVGIVYIAAFALDEGESMSQQVALGAHPTLSDLSIDAQGFAWLPEEDFLNHFAPDVDRVKAKVMFAVQQPLRMSVLEDAMGFPAWKPLPCRYLVATHDDSIPPDVQRKFAARMGAETVEVASSHVAMLSHPDVAVAMIESAADAVTAAGG